MKDPELKVVIISCKRTVSSPIILFGPAMGVFHVNSQGQVMESGVSCP